MNQYVSCYLSMYSVCMYLSFPCHFCVVWHSSDFMFHVAVASMHLVIKGMSAKRSCEDCKVSVCFNSNLDFVSSFMLVRCILINIKFILCLYFQIQQLHKNRSQKKKAKDSKANYIFRCHFKSVPLPISMNQSMSLYM